MIAEPQYPETLYNERLFFPFVLLWRPDCKSDWRVESGNDNYLRLVAEGHIHFEKHGGQLQVWHIGENVRTLLFERGTGEIVAGAFGGLAR